MAWAVTSEIYPSRYRSTCIALCAASNWVRISTYIPLRDMNANNPSQTFNFFIGFATPFIERDIGFSYGYLFAGFNFLAVLVVFFFLPETAGRSLEEIDTMFLLEVKPWKSSKWTPPQGEDLISADRLRLSQGGRRILKREEAGDAGETQYENVHDVRQSSVNPAEASGVRGNSITAV